jgi:hypothetical protein
MTAIHHVLAAIGVDLARIHIELFGALPSINPGLPGPTGHLRPHRHLHLREWLRRKN